MKVAYLVNQYPKTSHSFIRREIAGVEAAGVEVVRFSVRRVAEPLIDPRDVQERERTTVLLDAGAVGLAAALLRSALLSPLRFVSALRSAWQLSRRSDKGLLKHAIYLAEACVLKSRLAGVDHLHAHFATNPTSVALLCHKLGGPPFSFTVHSTQSAETPETNALSLKLKNARFACAVSRHGLGQLQRYSPIERWPMLSIIHCGVDEEYLSAESTPLPDEPVLVCVARFSPEKGLFSLLEAAGLLASRGVDFTLVLVGDGALRKPLEARARELGIEQNLRFDGWCDGAGVRDRMIAARALVLPSYVEGLPVVAMEALALGRPVVATSVGGLPELIVEGTSGRLVPCGSPEELSRGLEWALSSEIDLSGIVKGTARVRERHDASKEGARLAALFSGSVASHHSTFSLRDGQNGPDGERSGKRDSNLQDAGTQSRRV